MLFLWWKNRTHKVRTTSMWSMQWGTDWRNDPKMEIWPGETMSSTGHYTRYINEYNQKSGKKHWSDNCDTMFQPVFHGLIRCDDCLAWRKDCPFKEKKEEYCPDQIGYFQVEHNHGNTWAWCTFSDEDRTNNPIKKRIYHLPIYSFTGKKAIQNVLEYMIDYPVSDLIDRIFKYRFYNRSYLDYGIEVEEWSENGYVNNVKNRVPLSGKHHHILRRKGAYIVGMIIKHDGLRWKHDQPTRIIPTIPAPYRQERISGTNRDAWE